MPDGNYYASTSDLFKNSEGSYDSETYHNVLRIKAHDRTISPEIHNKINAGMYLIHETENKAGDTWDPPYSAGCISPPGDQPGQDRFMGGIPIPSRSNPVIILFDLDPVNLCWSTK